VGDRLNIDQAIVGVASAGASSADIANAVWMKTAALQYADGVWIDTISGVSGVSIQDGYGTSTKPVKYYDQGITIASTLGVKRFYLKPASHITLTQNHDRWRFIGAGTVVLGGQSVANSVFEEVYTVSGVAVGDDMIFSDCGIGNITTEHAYFKDCNFKGVMNFTTNSDYFLLNCNDATSTEYGLGADAPTFVFASGASVYMRDWRGGVQLNGMGATNICMLDGAGRLVIDPTSVSGTISVRGHFPAITGAAAFGGTITQTSRFSTDNVTDANVVSVSGTMVSIEDFVSGLTAAAVRTEMDLNSLKLTAISGSVAGLAGEPMRGTNNAATAVSLSALSGVIPGLLWNETLSGHQTTGSTGYALNVASGNLIGMRGTDNAATAVSLSAPRIPIRLPEATLRA
jgi:hypothetical protein